MANMAASRLEMMEYARVEGLLLECEVCFSDQCLETDMISFPAGHSVCKDCVKQGAEVQVGEGRFIIV
jgi:hypothetical protein